MARWRNVRAGKGLQEEQSKQGVQSKQVAQNKQDLQKAKSKSKDNNLRLFKQPQSSSINHQAASILLRFKAFLTDAFMITIPIFYIVIYLIMGDRNAFESNMTLGWIYILIPHFTIIILFWNKKSQTPGYKAYELFLVDAKTLEKPSLVAFIIRYFMMIISFFTIVGFAIAYFRKDKMMLHDLISGTYPVKFN